MMEKYNSPFRGNQADEAIRNRITVVSEVGSIGDIYPNRIIYYIGEVDTINELYPECLYIYGTDGWRRMNTGTTGE